MQTTNTIPTSTARGREACEEILARLSDDSRRALERWRRLVNFDSTYLGGRGRTQAQMSVAARVWDELPPAAHWAYLSVLYATEHELADAVREMGVPERAEQDIDAIEVLLGPDHPAFKILPVYALVTAYRDAVERIGD